MAKVSFGKDQDQSLCVKLSSQSMVLKNQDCRVLTIQDLSQVNELASLKAKTQSLSMMASTVNHEMLTPLKCIIMISDKLKSSIVDVKQRQEYLQTIS